MGEEFQSSIQDLLSDQIERYKTLKSFDTYIETILDFLNNEIIMSKYKFLDYDNIKIYLNKSLTEKLFLEASSKCFIEKKHRAYKSTLFDDIL